MHTEPEAKTKWCPFVREYSNAGCNRLGGGPADNALCIGSACMAWRWQRRDKVRVTFTGDDQPWPPMEWDRGGYEKRSAAWGDKPGYQHEAVYLDDLGFCGLAGAPSSP